MQNQLRRLALVAAFTGGLVVGGIAVTSPASAAPSDTARTASVSPMMYVENGPFESKNACLHHWSLNKWPWKTDCSFLWDSYHFGWYYGEYTP
jgi:hypothetical protein